MKKVQLLWGLMLLAGCSYKPLPVSVTGQSGKAYTAPDLCTALVACKNAHEPSCYYNVTVSVDVTGNKELESCKQVQ
jgi:uncharacterized lipoprotein YajG